MIGFLNGVPGKLATLLGRLTATRAANLDNLDALISTRAPASSALSSAVWTAGHANQIALAAQEDTPLLDVPIANGIATPPVIGLAGISYLSAGSCGDIIGTQSTTFVDLATGTYTGKGLLKGAVFAVTSDAGASRTGTFEIIIDGMTVLSTSISPPASATYGAVAVGNIVHTRDNTVSLIYYAAADDAIPFKTSIQIRYKISNAAGWAYAAAKILKTG